MRAEIASSDRTRIDATRSSNDGAQPLPPVSPVHNSSLAIRWWIALRCSCRLLQFLKLLLHLGQACDERAVGLIGGRLLLHLLPARVGVLLVPRPFGFWVEDRLQDQVIQRAVIIAETENAIARLKIEIRSVQFAAMGKPPAKVCCVILASKILPRSSLITGFWMTGWFGAFCARSFVEKLKAEMPVPTSINTTIRATIRVMPIPR